MTMDLRNYFAKRSGLGILTTSNVEGDVNAAIYAKPTIGDDNTLALKMLSRLSYANIQSNPKAAYMFIEAGEEHQGVRLYLTKISEEEKAPPDERLQKKYPRVFKQGELDKHIVCFRVDRIRPLVDEGRA